MENDIQEAKRLIHRALVALDEGDREQARALLSDALTALSVAAADARPGTLAHRVTGRGRDAPANAPPRQDAGEMDGKKKGKSGMNEAIVFVVVIVGLTCGLCGYQFLITH